MVNQEHLVISEGLKPVYPAGYPTLRSKFSHSQMFELNPLYTEKVMKSPFPYIMEWR